MIASRFFIFALAFVTSVQATFYPCVSGKAISSWMRISRGGASEHVTEPSSMKFLHTTLGNAGDETLVVLDFSATWCGKRDLVLRA
jgi:hypothetical protein